MHKSNTQYYLIYPRMRKFKCIKDISRSYSLRAYRYTSVYENNSCQMQIVIHYFVTFICSVSYSFHIIYFYLNLNKSKKALEALKRYIKKNRGRYTLFLKKKYIYIYFVSKIHLFHGCFFIR